MDEGNMQRVRDIIILSFSSDETGIRFDTDKVLNKGFAEAEIEEAEMVILAGPTLTLINSSVKFQAASCPISRHSRYKRFIFLQFRSKAKFSKILSVNNLL